MIETKEQLINFLKDKTVVHWYEDDVQVYQTYTDNKKASNSLNDKRKSKNNTTSGLFAFFALSDSDSIWKCAELLLRDAYHPMINNKKIFKYH